MLVACAGSSRAPGPADPALGPADPAAPTSTDPAPQGPPDAGAADSRLPEPCGDYASVRGAFVCAKDGMSRVKCPDGVNLVREACARGCLRAAAGTDAVCMGTSSPWSCSGTFGTERARDGDYFLTTFGCWVDAAGGKHGDPADNCVPACLSTLKQRGLCPAADTGRACEERISWFVADSARFGCGARVRVTNPATGRSVVAVSIDEGPACSIERVAQRAVLDTSGRVSRELFGSDRGVAERALVHVVEVDATTPLGP